MASKIVTYGGTVLATGLALFGLQKGIEAYKASTTPAPKKIMQVAQPTEYTLLADPFGRDGERISFEYTKPAKDVMPKSTAYLKTITDSNKEVTIKFDDILRGEGSRTLYRMKAGDRFILQDENNKKGDLEDIKIIAAILDWMNHKDYERLFNF